ncbi:MAG: hypothetical protein JWQ11_3550 [Rhizobacter sp.]|nr:hypothetical protein [Rhizobacter sp.]
MSPNQPPITARQYCEAVLKTGIAYNEKHCVSRAETVVATRLLAQGLELANAYEEVVSKLTDAGQSAVPNVLNALITVAAQWNPDAARESREARDRLVCVNAEIFRVASDLADLLSQRNGIEYESAFEWGTIWHIVDALHAGGSWNRLYGAYLEAEFDALDHKLAAMYWPSLPCVIRAIADNAAAASPTALDAMAHAGTKGPRSSLADSFYAFYAAIERLEERHGGPLPDGFGLTDRTVASLLSCALDLGPDDGIVDAAYVKRLRQRVRARERHNDTETDRARDSARSMEPR